MVKHWILPFLLLACLVALLASACGGGDDDDTGDGDGDPPEATETEDEDSGNGDDNGEGDGGEDGDGPVDGPLVTVSGLGLYAIDRTSGEGRAVDLADVDGADVRTPPALGDGTVYALTFTRIEGQSFSNTAYITRIDLATGENAIFAEVGFDRESDDSQELFEYPEIIVAAGDVWVVKQPFGPGEHQLLRFDGETGELVATIPGERLRGFVTDGERLYQFASEGLRALDPAANTFEVLLPSDATLADAAPAGADLAALFATRSGEPLSGDDLDFATDFAGRIDAANVSSNTTGVSALAYGDGAIWMSWSTFGIQTQGGDSAIGQALLRFDLDSNSIDAIVPLAGTGEHFLEENTVSSSIGDITWQDGSLWVVIPQRNGAVGRVDPASLAFEVTYEPCAGDFVCDDRDDVTFNRTDPDGLWIEFARLVDQGDGSRVGEIFLVRIDTATGEQAVEVPIRDLF